MKEKVKKSGSMENTERRKIVLDKPNPIAYNIVRRQVAGLERQAFGRHTYAAMAQVVEHILGKDEVTSSNLVSSSIQKYGNPHEHCVHAGFCFLFENADRFIVASPPAITALNA